ncbi:hypothetical protein HAX54_017006 [Datura stramonium]|uniref:Protein kinase domain-containing protein n=1 Tax=Datura stramonium TaxID=4076 RepID=A0ABS8S0V9_DATST|nr:hypothetical protein [Datura stramonium]
MTTPAAAVSTVVVTLVNIFIYVEALVAPPHSCRRLRRRLYAALGANQPIKRINVGEMINRRQHLFHLTSPSTSSPAASTASPPSAPVDFPSSTGTPVSSPNVGDNNNGQLDVPSNLSYEYFGLALRMNHACGIRCESHSGLLGKQLFSGLLRGQSQNLCFGNEVCCRPCDFSILAPPTSPPSLPPPPLSPSSPSRRLRRGLLAFAIVGSVGTFAGICSIIYFLWTGGFGSPVSRSSTLRRQGSRLMRRQRSGTSSKHADRAEEFLFTDLAAATNNFSLENKIGAGSFGIVYKGKLPDGREVAIKRGETGTRMKKFQEKESAFDSELSFLSRLHHKHLVRLVGYCEEKDERLLVYEYMKNGALFDHLHDKNNVEKSSSIVNSWKMRIKIALDAARGIEYLHNYAVPPIIHRDIKSSNILIDANWFARYRFGLSLMGPESNRDYSSRPVKAAGTVRKRAIFKTEENGGAPMSVVDFGVPLGMAGELTKILDNRVGPGAN